MPRKRPYDSETRRLAAEETRRRVLEAARALFSKRGIDKVTVGGIAARAGVAESTIYSLYRSKAGILRALMDHAIFGAPYHAAARRLEGTTDPLELLRLTAGVARNIYENESREIGLLRGVSGFSPELRKLEREFEDSRFRLQRRRVELLFEHSLARAGLELEEARRILWLYTSREVYRMLVVEGGWTPDRYESWLAQTLVEALTAAGGPA